MPTIPTKEIERSLLKKGFQKGNTHHRYFYLFINGKKTSIRTKLSHGSKIKEYGDKLLNLMKKQLKFDSSADLIQFIKCPLTKQDYLKILGNKNLL